MAPIGAQEGTVEGHLDHISTYLAQGVTGYSIANNILFCIAPDLVASHDYVDYTVVSGVHTVGTDFTTLQANALMGIFSTYWNSGDTSFDNQAATMIADWTIVNPSITISGVPIAITDKATMLVMEALSGHLTIDQNLQFQTFLSTQGGQSFVNITPTPIPASAGLLLTALIALAVFGWMKKRFHH
jgi:hypothetical protein